VTRRRRTHENAERQREIISALLDAGGAHVTRRLQRCMQVRLARRRGDGWPEVCRSAGCAWCGPTLARRWWRGIERWIVDGGGPVSLVVLPLRHRPGELRAHVAGIRRALRDLRDRTARRNRLWRGVALAGMVAASGEAFVLVRHPGIDRTEVARVLRSRWPGAIIADVGSLSLSWEFSIEHAVGLARASRGVEPLRIVVLARRASIQASRRDVRGPPIADLEPMPLLLYWAELEVS
jgi:hypothetical protein